MVDVDLLEELLTKAGYPLQKCQEEARQRMADLNKTLNERMESQRMTPEVLNKRCTI